MNGTARRLPFPSVAAAYGNPAQAGAGCVTLGHRGAATEGISNLSPRLDSTSKARRAPSKHYLSTQISSHHWPWPRSNPSRCFPTCRLSMRATVPTRTPRNIIERGSSAWLESPKGSMVERRSVISATAHLMLARLEPDCRQPSASRTPSLRFVELSANRASSLSSFARLAG